MRKEMIMETRTIFNPIQLHLLKMFEVNSDEQSLSEMKEVLCRYYRERLDQKLDKLWNEGVVSPDTLDEIKHTHLRIHT